MLISLFRCVICLLGAAIVIPASGADEADGARLASQRERFPFVLETARHAPGDGWQKLADGLENYPLFPYLELASLQGRMDHLKRAEVDKFLRTWPASLPAQMLRDAFLLELAKRSEWKDFLALAPDAPRSKAIQCYTLDARVALSQPVDFKRDVEPLWLSASALPPACDGIVRWSKEHGKLTADLVWTRIDLAARAGNGAVVTSLAPMLEGAERSAAERVARAVQEPAKLLGEAAAWTDAPRARAAVVVAFERLARHDSEAAETYWSKLEAQFRFDAEQRGRILRALALYRATSYSPDAMARLDALPADLADENTREWRVRVALAAQDFAKTLKALDALSSTQQSDPRWRYLRARVLTKLERGGEASAAFSTLAREANFHGFLAADWLKQPYAICPIEVADDPAQR